MWLEVTAMSNPRQRCIFCHRWFTPYVRQRNKQTVCYRILCRKKRHAVNCRQWREANPGPDPGRASKIRAWARRRMYWKGYRRDHATYRAREKTRMRSMRQRVKRVAKRDSLSEMAVGKIREIQGLECENVAKRDSLARRMEGVLGFLLWKENVARRDSSLLVVG